MSAPTSAAAVANAFLDIQADDHGQFPRIDQMKLYKLVYYAHAWWLAKKGEPLFEEDVHAWPWGPVVPSLYGEFKSAERGYVTHQRATEIVRVGDGKFDFSFHEPPSPSDDIMRYLRQVWDVHKELTGVQLSNATHAPGEPWSIVKDKYNGDLSSKPLIPNGVIESVFKEKLQHEHAG